MWILSSVFKYVVRPGESYCNITSLIRLQEPNEGMEARIIYS